jgi:hypothetical protein
MPRPLGSKNKDKADKTKAADNKAGNSAAQKTEVAVNENQLKLPTADEGVEGTQKNTEQANPPAQQASENSEALQSTAPPIQNNATDAPVSTDIPNDLWDTAIPKVTEPQNGPIAQKDYTQISGPEKPAATAPGKEGDKKDGKQGTLFVEPSHTAKPIDPPLTPEQERIQATQTAEFFLEGYDGLHALMRGFSKLKDTDLALMHESGEINLYKKLPLRNKTITLQEFFASYNSNIDKYIVVDKEFKEAVKPALIRVIIKNKWYMSDEIFLMGMFGKDISQKAGMLWGLRKAVHELIDYEKQTLAELKKQNSTGNKENGAAHQGNGQSHKTEEAAGGGESSDGKGDANTEVEEWASEGPATETKTHDAVPPTA